MLHGISSGHTSGLLLVMLLLVPLAAMATGDAAASTGEVDHERIRRDRLQKLLPEIMKEQGIDAWLTFTRESTTDPLLAVLGVDHIVARGAVVFAWQGDTFRKVAIAASYDVDPFRNTGLYDEVIGYRSEGVKPHLKALIEELAPRKIAINYSRDVTIADGLTLGMRR